MSNTWTGLGIGTKDSKGEWLEMFFSEEDIKFVEGRNICNKPECKNNV